MWPDLINGSIELVGAWFTWRNFQELRRERILRGVYWPTTAFFSVWGLWNLIYYPALGQWFSFAGGVLLVAGNLAWVVLAISLALDKTITETFMSCEIAHDDDGRVTEFHCGPAPQPTDHDCDNKGPTEKVESGMGAVHSATCSICGRPAFDTWGIW